MENTFHDLSKKSSIFRSRLIDEFHLLDDVANTATVQAPKHTSRDITDLKMRNKILLDNPNQLIKFQAFKKTQQTDDDDKTDRRLTRTRNINSLPIGAWANWLVKYNYFQYFIMFFILADSVFIGVKTELQPYESQYWALFQFITILDYFSCIVFITEIVLKLLDNFEEFWNDGWNVADLLVTLFSLIPEITDMAGVTGTALMANGINPQSFRVIRALKVVFRVGNFQIMIITILEAFHSMASIMLVVLIVSYVYSIVGVYLYRDYTVSTDHGLLYQLYFMDIGQSMFTLFQLLTLDQWDTVNRDLIKETDSVWSNLYVISWVCLGAFIFRNIFVGVMVNHFDKISNTLREEIEASKKVKTFEKMKKRLKRELEMQGKFEGSIANLKAEASEKEAPMKKRKSQGSMSKKDGEAAVKSTVQKLLVTSSGLSKGWDETVGETLAALEDANVETMWPRDSLFEYLQVMELLHENMAEYEELQKLCTGCLLELHDT
ncbi:hypothetical protein BCR33DRAFT_713541 [Rhizoclosmatium globosum]|uniref:Ion transport domain-containing protein n=1 Tax=Rhizoclosmatium globosum TaxID=329046 RepID=A0A1Y2CUE4_9FUNG|nr:hypothetical protein BCR33DRAFT_713541 [Rhizoclosmatium globosum]|eukprot:ORY49945.1 hypothetical protein BCR33DRAFT_713541 [Rhizoclosmatium globosum]